MPNPLRHMFSLVNMLLCNGAHVAYISAPPATCITGHHSYRWQIHDTVAIHAKELFYIADSCCTMQSKVAVYNTVTLSSEANSFRLWDSLNYFILFTQPPSTFAGCLASSRMRLLTYSLGATYGQGLTLKVLVCDNWCTGTLWKRDNYSTVWGDGGGRVGEVRAGTTSPMPEHKGFKLQ